MESPVVSSVSGAVFEHRLITKYLLEKGPVDPVSGHPLSESQLVHLNQKCLLRSDQDDRTDQNGKPSLARSVPEVLRFLQDQWDSMLLLVFDLRTQLESSQGQLSALDQEHERKKQLIESLRCQLNTTRQQLERMRTRSCSINEDSSASSHRSSPLEQDTFTSANTVFSSSLPPTPVKSKGAPYSHPFVYSRSIPVPELVSIDPSSRRHASQSRTATVPAGSTCINTNERYLPDNFDKSVQLSRRLANSVADFSSDVLFVESAANSLTPNSRQFCSSEYVNLQADSTRSTISSALISKANGSDSRFQRASVAASDRSCRSASSRDELLVLHNANRQAMLSESCQDVTNRPSRCASVYSNWSEISGTSGGATAATISYSSNADWTEAQRNAVRSDEGVEPEVEYENIQELKQAIATMTMKEQDRKVTQQVNRVDESTCSSNTQIKVEDKKQLGRIQGWASDFERLIKDSIGINVFTVTIKTNCPIMMMTTNRIFWCRSICGKNTAKRTSLFGLVAKSSKRSTMKKKQVCSNRIKRSKC
jgi:hypothetical protein